LRLRITYQEQRGVASRVLGEPAAALAAPEGHKVRRSSTAGRCPFARERNTHTTIDTALGPINQGVIDMSQLSTGSGRQKKWVRSAAPPAQAPLTMPPLEAARLLGFLCFNHLQTNESR